MLNLLDARQEFIKFLKEKGRAQATIIAYGKDIEQLVTFLQKQGKALPNEVQLPDLKAFTAKLFKEEYTPKSVSRKINSIKTFFRFLKDREEIGEDPAGGLEHPKFEIKPPRILSKMEYRALRDACRNDARTYAVVETLLQSGVRISELANIRLGDIKFSNGKVGELFVRAQGNQPARTVPLNPAAQKAIKGYLEVRPESKGDYLFITKTGNPFLVRNIRATLDRYFKLAGIPNTKVNDLRHTFVAHHIQRGANLVVLSRIVGHKRLSTTERYLQYVERPQEEIKELEEL